MAELNENEVEIEKVEPKVRKSRSGFWFGIIILLIIIALAGVGYFLLDQIREKQEGLGGEIDKEDAQITELRKQITGYQTQIAAIQKQLTSINAEINGKENHFNNKLKDFSQLHADKLKTSEIRMQIDIERLQRQLGKTRGDWLVADAEYLLSVANQRLYLMSDVETTLEALEAADQRLRESGDAAAFKVREQLNKEIDAVEKVQMPDIIGLYAKIQVLEESVENLTLFLPYAGKGLSQTEPESKTEETKQDSANEDIIDTALDNLGDLVTIRYTDKPIKSVLTEQEAVFLREQLKVKLEMIKIALVQNNDALYKRTINDSKKWAREHFLDNANLQAMMNEMAELYGISLHSQLPDISQSLKMLRDITKLRIETDKALETKKTVREEQQTTTADQ